LKALTAGWCFCKVEGSKSYFEKVGPTRMDRRAWDGKYVGHVLDFRCILEEPGAPEKFRGVHMKSSEERSSFTLLVACSVLEKIKIWMELAE
jgi:hypothetical protein